MEAKTCEPSKALGFDTNDFSELEEIASTVSCLTLAFDSLSSEISDPDTADSFAHLLSSASKRLQILCRKIDDQTSFPLPSSKQAPEAKIFFAVQDPEAIQEVVEEMEEEND